MRQFFGQYFISCGWDCHRNRGSLGGIDRGLSLGTPLPACAAGVVTFTPNNGTGGHTVTIRHDDGTKTQYMHLSQFVGANGRRVAEGEIVGKSGGVKGAPGSGSSTGPHLHAHSITTAGVRVMPFYETGGGGGGTDWTGGGSKAAWLEIQAFLKRQGLYNGSVDGDPKSITWNALQRYLKAHWGYSGAIDGVPGKLSWGAMQRWLKSEAGYTGIVDGVPGPLTAASINRLGDKLKNAIAGNQRRVLSDASLRRRKGPGTSFDPVSPDLAANSVATFNGWTVGQEVKGNSTWVRNVDGTWSWSGGLTDTGTHDLPKIEPEPAPKPAELPEGCVYGVDVSFWQNALDWPTAKASGVEFAIIKAAGAEGSGGLYEAEKLDLHLTGARAAGLKIGFYFFNNGKMNVVAQAEFFVQTLRARIMPGDFVAVDVEPDGSTPQFTPAQVLEFTAHVEAGLGVKTLVYVNRSTMNGQDWSAVAAAGNPLWLAVLDGLQKSIDAPIKHWSHASVLQFEVGKVAGYSGDIDRNFAVEEDLESFGFVAFPSTSPEEPEPGGGEGEEDGDGKPDEGKPPVTKPQHIGPVAAGFLVFITMIGAAIALIFNR